MSIRIFCICVLAVAAAYAQPPGRGPERRGGFGPDGGPRWDGRIVGALAGTPNRIVKNAPYSADLVTETTRALADGNRIRQVSRARIWRDAEGRVRNELTLTSLGGLVPTAGSQEVVYITDPVAHVNYALNVAQKTATRSYWPDSQPWRNARRGGESGTSPVREERGPVPPPPGAIPPLGGRRGPRPEPEGRHSVNTESLGRQTIDGLPADGSRTTISIPAGEVGNEQTLQIVSETWYSPDLQIVILSRHSDPRMGERVFRVTNIERSNPAASLFQPPADYNVTDDFRGGARRGVDPRR